MAASDGCNCRVVCPRLPCAIWKFSAAKTTWYAATFGRGFFILDDYSPLRGGLTAETLAQEGAMLPLRRAYLFHELGYVRAQGNFATPNPPFGAALTYYLRQDLPRSDAKVALTVTDANGKTVRTLNGPITAGVHRIYWDLRDDSHATPRFGRGAGRGRGADEEEEEEEAQAQSESDSELRREAEQERPPRRAGRGGAAGPDTQMVSLGEYRVSLAKVVGGVTTTLGQLQSFNVVPLPTASSTPDSSGAAHAASATNVN